MAGPGQSAKTALGQAYGTAAGYGSEAADIGATLMPELTREALHPTGFNPADLNAMSVAGQQATGGAAGSLSGEAGLRAARSRNNAALGGTLDEIAREKMRSNSENALGIQSTNARLKESQRQQGLSGLERLRGGDVNAQLHAMSLLPEDINAWTNAAKREPSMFQDILGTIGTITGGKGFKIPGLS